MGHKGLIGFLTTGGSTGDVRPLIALALAMRARGFEIVFLADPTFEPVALRAGIAPSEWFTWGQVPQSFILRTTAGQRWLWGQRERYRDRWMRREIAQHRARYAERFWRRVGAPHETRMVAAIGSVSAFRMLLRIGPHCARIVSSALPLQTSRYVDMHPPDLSLFARMHLWWRRRQQEPEQRRFCEDLFHLVSVSPFLFPKPIDWLPHMQVTGYLALDDQRGPALPAALRTFLDTGPPPVFVGFGSYPHFCGPRGERLAQTIVDACRQRGRRCIIQASDLAPSFASEDVLILEGDVSYAHLFPRCAAIVHHGGYGTVHCALAARRPMIAYPIQTDQFFWATRMGQLGVGPGFTGRLRDLTATRMAADLAFVLRPECEEAARHAGTAVLNEEGLPLQVAAIESIIEHTRRGGLPQDWRMPDVVEEMVALQHGR